MSDEKMLVGRSKLVAISFYIGIEENERLNSVQKMLGVTRKGDVINIAIKEYLDSHREGMARYLEALAKRERLSAVYGSPERAFRVAVASEEGKEKMMAIAAAKEKAKEKTTAPPEPKSPEPTVVQ